MCSVFGDKTWLSKGKPCPQTAMPIASSFKEMFKFNHYVWTSSAYNHIYYIIFSKELLLMLPNLYFLSKHCSQASFSLRFPWIWQQLGSQCIAIQYLLFSVFLYEKKKKKKKKNICFPAWISPTSTVSKTWSCSWFSADPTYISFHSRSTEMI